LCSRSVCSLPVLLWSLKPSDVAKMNAPKLVVAKVIMMAHASSAAILFRCVVVVLFLW